MAEALYNKYRPQIFEDVVGQEHIERTLKNAIANDKISHAYMFTGPRGTGKTTTARLLAKALLCESGPTPDPDGTCEDCGLVASGEHPDVYELDAASRTGVENVREEIIGKVNYAPTRGRYKVYIIDEVHMLSTAAFNALLKTLEEPPSHVVFVLCTTDPQKVPETIQSRCQRFDFRRIASEELISRLGAICEMEGIEFEGDALDLIAHRANGGMRDALTSLDQLIAFGDGSVTSEVAERLLGAVDSSELGDIVGLIGKRDIAGAFRWTAEYMETGADLVQFVEELTSHMRDMYVMSLVGADVALEVTEAARRELEAELPLFGSERLARTLIVLGDLAMDLKTSTNQRLSFEIALTRLVRPEGDLTLEALAERVEALERAGVGGMAMPATGAGGIGGVAAAAVQASDMAAVSDIRGAGADRGAANASHGEVPASQGSADPSFDAIGDAASRMDGASQMGGAAGVASGSSAAADRDVPSAQAANVQSANSQAADAQSANGQADSQAGAQANAQSNAQARGGAQDASASVSAASIGLASRNLGSLWDSVLAHLKKVGAAYGAVFLNTRAEMSGDELHIIFPAENQFAFKAAQKPDAREALEASFGRAGIGGVQYQIVQADPSAGTAFQSAKPQTGSGGDMRQNTASSGGSAQGNVQEGQARQDPIQGDPAHKAGASEGFDAQNPVTQDPVTQTSVTQNPVTQDPTTQTPVAQDPAPSSAASQEPSSQDAAAKSPEPDNAGSQDPGGAKREPVADAPAADDDFSDYLMAAFGESVVIEEINDNAE